ncbi:late histone H2A.2.2-like [Culicoides brevitarsis]|uniref:late histone H2A.2.2-like n=1 Tax=Culicoides brevitarsis TaxID=469753 RepID=UPI00307C545D
MTPRAKGSKAQSVTPPMTPIAKTHKPKPALKSLTKNSDLHFNVYKMLRKLKKDLHAKVVQRGAAVYFTAVIEYLVAEVLELAADMAKRHNKSRLTPRFIMMAIRTDEELNMLFGNIDISEAGIIPHIHSVLLPKPKKGRVIAEDKEKKLSNDY